MAVPRGNTRKLVIALGEIQNLVGMAKGAAMNDRSMRSMDILLRALDDAFRLCVDARSLYDPVEVDDDESR